MQNAAQTPLATSGDSRPEGYVAQRERVIQLLKDHSNNYSTVVSCNPFAMPGQPTPDIPTDEVSDGHWNMTPEGLRRLRGEIKGDPYIQSHVLLADELEAMKRLHSLHLYAIEKIFLDDAEYGAYDDFIQKATTIRRRIEREAQQMISDGEPAKDVVAYLKKARIRHNEVVILTDLEAALEQLTLRLMGYNLHVVKPSKAAPTNKRRLSMEEKYRNIFRVFDDWCRQIEKKHSSYRTRAYQATVDTTGESRSTVERAVQWVEAGEPAETQSRKRTVKKTRCANPATTPHNRRVVRREKENA